MLGVRVLTVAPEELLWSKAFIMERERYDGADVIHIIRSGAERLDWERIRTRFGTRWRVLLGHLVMFGFVYPGERSRIPAWLMTDLLSRLNGELVTDSPAGRLCQGTVISREQYLPDTLEWGYEDARLAPLGGMTAQDIAQWTAAIGKIK